MIAEAFIMLATEVRRNQQATSRPFDWPGRDVGTPIAIARKMASGRRSQLVVVSERVNRAILILRGHSVMLDADLAALYHVDIKALNQAVRRNRARFPSDFVFQLNVQEAESLRSQIVTLKSGRGRHRKYLPYAFTEQGVAMLSGVLHSHCAVRVNIEIMRAFVRQRRILLQSSAQLADKLDALEKKCDSRFKTVFQVIRELVAPPVAAKRRIGFREANS